MRAVSSFDVMVKPRGAMCNLACEYCYYLPKEKLYPDGSFWMDDALLDTFTRQYIEAQDAPQVTFAWQGGEPLLMGLDFFRRAVELQERYRKPGMTISNALQTNGTLLDDDWCHFLKERCFLVGISIDGPREQHDAYRVDRGGKPTFERVMAGVEMLKKGGVQFNTLTCVHAANGDHPLAVYRFLRDRVGSSYMQFIPVVVHDTGPGRRGGDPVTRHSVRARQYGEFLKAIFDEWVRRDVGKVFVQTFDAALASWAGQSPGLCVYAETCGTAPVLEHNGDLYSCDHFVDPDHLLGNIAQTGIGTLARSERQRRFGLAKRDSLPQYCCECPVLFACNGGCPRNRFLRTPTGEPGLNYLCAGYRDFFTHVIPYMRSMVEELSAGRPAANIMLTMARKDAELQQRLAKARRNDPCPCGSGRKFKHCHGRR